VTALIHHGTLTVITLALAIFGAPFAAKAQPAGKIYRIGWLDHTGLGHFIGTFQEGMGDLGWKPGENFVVEYRGGGGRYERLPELAAELVRLPVDVIVAPDTAATLAARRATSSIPIVMVSVGDPVGSGIVASLARPGGNVTGMSNVFPELAGKQLELLKQVVPRLLRVAVLWEAGDPDGRQIYEQLQQGGRSLGVSLHSWELQHANDIEPAFSAMTKDRTTALITLGTGTLVNHDQVVDHALRRRLPIMSTARSLALIGGLMSYGPSLPPMFRRAAVYVDKILKGTKPAALPVEQPTTFELVVNLKTAKALGLSIPQSVLLRADRVIE